MMKALYMTFIQNKKPARTLKENIIFIKPGVVGDQIHNKKLHLMILSPHIYLKLAFYGNIYIKVVSSILLEKE